jgi:very-short-patch-repair endonuclease
MTAKLTKYARRLRRNSTQAEALLWSRIRGRQIEGIKFRRQQPIENFIVDFISFEKRIVVQHAIDKGKDRERDRLLTENGFTVFRFWDNQVFENLEGVLEVIRKKCMQ